MDGEDYYEDDEFDGQMEGEDMEAFDDEPMDEEALLAA